ncbi:MAG: dephospho-CoA kinase [Acidimicrobiia bacterium]
MAVVWVVTGGIGSGKSTIRRTLEELGAVTIDADRIGHAVLEPGGTTFDAVAERWPQVVTDDGLIDRAALGGIVFADPDELHELEAITHPAIGAGIGRRIDDAGDRVVVVEISVPKDLVGAGWLQTVVADLPTDERRQRLIDRGMEPEDVDRRMASQPSRDGWRARGRWVISTSGTRDQVAERVHRLWEQVIQDSR